MAVVQIYRLSFQQADPRGGVPLLAASIADSPLVQTIVGVAFLFVTLSIIASAAQELVAAALALRSRSLATGVQRLIGDRTLADAVLAHPLIDGQSQRRGRRPSYLAADTFRMALLDVLAPTETALALPASLDIDVLLERMPDARLRSTLRSLWHESRHDLDVFAGRVEHWFDDGMDRVSGWYKRQIRWVIFAIGLVLAVGINVSMIDVVNRLWSDPTERSVLVAAADAANRSPLTDATATDAAPAGVSAPAALLPNATTPNGTVPDAKAAIDTIDAQIHSLGEFGLGIGWPERAPRSLRAWLVTAMGWLATAVGVSLGAPFWFDVLNRVSSLRTSGPRRESGPQSPRPVEPSTATN